MSPVKVADIDSYFLLTLVASIGSCPAIMSNTIALSYTVRVNGPIWSKDEANAINPYLLTNP